MRLTELEGKMNNVNNYCIAVKEKGTILFSCVRLSRGGADKSYGIQVARLARVPDMVIDRAKEIVEQLSDNDITEKVQSISIVDGGARLPESRSIMTSWIWSRYPCSIR